MPPSPLGHSWFIPGRIAAGVHPDRWGKTRDFLEALRLLGFDSVLSLSESAPDPAMLDELGFRHLHVPIANEAAPTLEQAKRAVDFIRERIENDGQIYVHCLAGYGRTGAILAAYLVATGEGPFKAIEWVRSKRPGSIETREQERFVVEFARSLRNRR